MIALALITSTCAEQPALVRDVAKETFEFPSGDAFQLAPPTIDNGMTAKQRINELSQLAGNAGWKRFSRKSAVAPVTIKVKYLTDSQGNHIGHSLHIAFVVHASIETLRDKNLMQQIFHAEQKSEEPKKPTESEVADQQFSEVQLAEMGITKAEDTSFSKAEFELLKKIKLRGVIQIQRAATQRELDYVFRLDPRFNNANETANAWTRINKNDATQTARDVQWFAYSGAAGYLVVRKLPELDGACLIESRILLHEPTDWFNGSHLLRSKLPLIIQETARSFRRKLK